MIHCPNCQFPMALQGLRPGRFTPKCQKCGKPFLLVVPQDTNLPPEVSVLPAAGAAPAKPAVTQATAAPASTTAAEPARHKNADTMHTAAPPAASPRAATAPSRAAPVAVESQENLEGANLGGYEINKKLGQGGMGTVYLARQVSLDRDVAVKVMNPGWANDAQFVARFTREAYAAAQLVHHNVVQIHDIGADDDLHYFSMEYVRGNNLAATVANAGKLDVEAAAGYILQAARGLKFAHEQGMVHRDIKPENLLLNEQGIVKVADLGLVKTPGSDAKLDGKGGPGASTSPAGVGSSRITQSTSAAHTQLEISMGTPAYMAPEQARDAATADLRADIYSLGCTFYALVTGQPPYGGKSAIEVISKHQSEPMVPPEIISKRVPKALSEIILKMTAKLPEDRYQSMDEVIIVLEKFLGLSSAGPFTPKEEHAAVLEEAVKKFNGSPKAALRKMAIMAYFAACGIGVVGCAALGSPWFAGGLLGLMVLTFLSYIVITGITQKTFLFRKLRGLVFGSKISDWLLWTVALVGAVVVLSVFGQFWLWVGFAVAAVAVALGFHVVIDRMVAGERKVSIDQTEALLRSMRLRGLEENALRQFVCRYSWPRWEEFYEAIFGYEGKMQARELWGRGQQSKNLKKYGAWRDGVIAWVDKTQQSRHEAKERKLLQKLEQKSLQAAGMDAAQAKQQADAQAESMVYRASEMKSESSRRAAETMAPGAVKLAPVKMSAKSMSAPPDDEAARRDRARGKASKHFGGAIGMLIMGPKTRFILGAVLMAICLMWLNQNDLIKAGEWKRLILNTANKGFNSVANPWDKTKLNTDIPKENLQAIKPVEIPAMPQSIAKDYFNSPAVGVAGLLLVLSVFRPGSRMGLFMLPAAAIMVTGAKLGMPDIPVSKYVISAAILSIAAGMVLAVMGYRWGREKT